MAITTDAPVPQAVIDEIVAGDGLRRRPRRHALSATRRRTARSHRPRRRRFRPVRASHRRFAGSRRVPQCPVRHSDVEAQVESAAVSQPVAGGEPAKLKEGALGYLSNLVIGVASTAPALLARGDARLHRRGRRRRRARAGGAARLVRPDAVRRGGLPLPEPGRPGPRARRSRGSHAALGPAHRLAQRLGDRRRRHHRDGGARADRRRSTRSCCSAGTRPRTRTARRSSWRSSGSP